MFLLKSSRESDFVIKMKQGLQVVILRQRRRILKYPVRSFVALGMTPKLKNYNRITKPY